MIGQNSDGIARLYDHYADALYGVILRIVASEDIASEILQDTFVKAWHKGNLYNPEAGRIFTWLMRIARNLSINHIKSKAARISHNIQGDEKLVYLSDHQMSTTMETLDLRGKLNQLENKYQVIVEMIYFQGYTHKELSQELGIPIGTVKSRIKIALRELRKIYEFRLSSVAICMILILTTSL